MPRSKRSKSGSIVSALRPRRPYRTPHLTRLLENLPADQHAADFAGAGADLVELGVAQETPGGKIVDVTVAAEALDSLERHPGGALGCVKDRAGGVLARGLAAVAGARHGIDIGFRGVERHIHVGELGLDELEASDRLAELGALMDVWNDQVEACLHHAERARRQHGALV